MGTHIVRFFILFLAVECVTPLLPAQVSEQSTHIHFHKKESSSLFATNLLNSSLEEKGEEKGDRIIPVIIADFSKIPSLLSMVYAEPRPPYRAHYRVESQPPLYSRICKLLI